MQACESGSIGLRVSVGKRSVKLQSAPIKTKQSPQAHVTDRSTIKAEAPVEPASRDASQIRAREAVVSNPSAVNPTDPCLSLQAFLVLDMMTRVVIWGSSIAFATMLMTALKWWPPTGLVGAGPAEAWAWGGAIVRWTLLFNMIYVAELALLRLPIPQPKQGIYSTTSPPDIRTHRGRQLIWSCMIAVLTKARYEAPFPGFLVFHIANIPPMRWIMGRVFGPKSKSCYVTDPIILDPHLVEIGRNVVLGSGCNIAGHCQMPGIVVVRKTVIEDDVVIGANSTIFGGVHVHRGAVIAAGSVVAPFTTVGPGEYWSGVPAVKKANAPASTVPPAAPKG